MFAVNQRMMQWQQLALELLACAIGMRAMLNAVVPEQQFFNEQGYQTVYRLDPWSLGHGVCAILVLEGSIQQRTRRGQQTPLVLALHIAATMLWLPVSAIVGFWLLQLEGVHTVIAYSAGMCMGRMYLYSYFQE